MNKQKFIDLLEDPERIDEHDLELLEELATNFPYCQAAHVLIAKAAHDKGSMLAHQKLKKAAVYTTDRALLKRTLYHARPATFATTPDEVVRALAQRAGAELGPEALEAEIAQAESPQRPQASPIPDLLEEISETPSVTPDTILTELEARPLREEGVAREEEPKRKPLRVDQLDVIDRFILVNPRLTPNQADENASKDDLASESSRRNENLVSENLAIILTKQGKINKAIEIYHKLMLKHPEKKAYFAARIDSLEKL
ncbi:hypothetical protein SAMN05421823_101476 [Catalinimonas alkaloidigena]|uniref:Tetratricopeptide repeat-containing protein n=1 Tax=Catalinimonas alkaloidigena TaxID=1075417 RepID=A0A1G8XUB7_9BACT|nr:hypothetical protein [Catalinimonas alkaloidigena]SDJ94046.1 hypothetical protein SAMN05421823_101476 [Catalinimonas alkaloidigena]